MVRTTIGVISDGPELIAVLRESCPLWDFDDQCSAEGLSELLIIEGHGSAGVGKTAIRLTPEGGSHEAGALYLTRDLFLATPAEYIAFVLGLLGRSRQDVDDLRHVLDLTALIDAEDVSERITRRLLSLLGLTSATLYLHDPRLERYVASYSSEPVRDTGEFLPGIPPEALQRALASEMRVAIERKSNGTGIVVMPIQAGDDLLAVVRAVIPRDCAYDEGRLDPAVRYLEAVTKVVSNVYQLTRSRDLAMRDDLTKAFNRRFFESYLEEEIERSRRYGAMLSIIFLDLDDLKMVNNAHGHLIGSRTLQEVAKRILGAVRTIDKVVRFGGDEFCIILPQTDPDQAVLVANRVRRAMIEEPYQVAHDIEIDVTASFGIATYPTHAMTKDDLVRLADAAMFRVKTSTKNSVGIASADDAVPAPSA